MASQNRLTIDLASLDDEMDADSNDGSYSESDDALDLLTATSSTAVSPAPEPLRRSQRSHASVGKWAPKFLKRRRSLSPFTIQKNADKAIVKKKKVDDKKAITATLNDKKASLEASRRRWFHRHRAIFEPLLPSNTHFFDNISKEINASTDPIAYVPLHQLHEQPALIKGGEMKDYQLEGLSFLVYMYRNGMNCILGDEMGLGKTLQTLALFAHIKENGRGHHDPHLIICPLSVLSSWANEAARWLPSFRTVRFHGQRSERDRLKDTLRAHENHQPFDICITTYDTYLVEDSWFKTRRWSYVVLDEGHKIKNSGTNIAQKLQGMGGLFRLILTGTPVQNNLVELWALLHWLYPNMFTPTTEHLFKESFALSRGEYAIPILEACGNLLSKIMIRRTKAVVATNVPPRDELTVFIPLTEAQRFWYYRLLTRMDTKELKEIFDNQLDECEGSEGRKEIQSHLATQMQQGAKADGKQWLKLMNLLVQLRRLCDHPYLLTSAEPDPFVNGEHLVAASSKLIVIDKLLADILPKGERVLIFSQWTKMLDVLEDFMALRDIPYARLDGQTTRPRRTFDIKLFQQDDSPYKVFLISTKAGGLGINLTKATTVVMCDSDWNPQNDLQAIARAHRLGQTKTVKVYRLICRGSVEDQMLDRIRRKLFLSVKVMGSDSNSSDSKNPDLKAKELLDILRKGSSALSRTDDDMELSQFLGASIDEILQSSRSRDEMRDAKLKKEIGEGEAVDNTVIKNAEEEERILLSGVAQVESRVFEGRMVQRQSNKQIATEWTELQKRARVDRTVVVGGITVIAAHVGPEVLTTKDRTPPEKMKKAAHDWEDWCIYCHDGGELVLCSHCPRVFHAKCRGLSEQRARSSPFVHCPQHNCTLCKRLTSEAGGMLFRCRTCEQAFCEDCLPSDDIDAVGDVLPEFLLLDYGEKPSAYYIKCHDCRAHFEKHPSDWLERQQEFAEMQSRLEKKYATS